MSPNIGFFLVLGTKKEKKKVPYSRFLISPSLKRKIKAWKCGKGFIKKYIPDTVLRLQDISNLYS